MQRPHIVDRRDAGALAPGEELTRRLRVGAARVDVADIGGEEFKEADLCVLGCCRNNRELIRGETTAR
jgi:hypothetical protein